MTTAIIASQLTPELERIYFDALRHCDKYGIEGENGLRQVMGALAHRAFLEAIERFIKMKRQITALHMPQYRLYADGQFECIPQKLSPKEQEIMDQLDELIEIAWQRYSPPQAAGLTKAQREYLAQFMPKKFDNTKPHQPEEILPR